MTDGLDWQTLVVTVNGRAAIYAEQFPAMLDNAIASADAPDAVQVTFTQEVAADLLARFAGTWPGLGPHGARSRWTYLSLPNQPGKVDVFAFRGTDSSIRPTRRSW